MALILEFKEVKLKDHYCYACQYCTLKYFIGSFPTGVYHWHRKKNYNEVSKNNDAYYFKVVFNNTNGLTKVTNNSMEMKG